MGDQFNEQVDIVVQFTQKGLTELTNQAKAALNEIASSGLSGGAGAADIQGQLRSQAAAFVASAKAQIPNLPQGNQAAASAALNDFAKELRTVVDGLVAQVRRAGPEGAVQRVQEQLAQRSLAAQEAVLRNSALLGRTAPQVLKNEDILGTGGGKPISDAEATQQREAFAQVQAALIEAAQTIRRIAAIDAQDGGRKAYVAALAEAAVEEKTLVAELRTEVNQRLASNEAYINAQAEGTLAQRDLASRIRAAINAQLESGALPVVGAGEDSDAEGIAGVNQSRADLIAALQEAAAATTTEAEQTDVSALLQREASNKVSEAMQVAAAKIAEIAAIGTDVEGGTAAYVTAQAEAAFQEKFLAQQIATEASEREAASTEYLELMRRANVAQAEINSVLGRQAAVLSTGGAGAGVGSPVPVDWFQKLQAKIFNRPGNEPRDAASFSQLPQFLASKALTTGGFALSGAAFYGTFSAIRSAVEEANKFQVALVALEQEFKAADDAGDFPAVRQAILDISNETGVAASQVAGIAQVFKGAFGDTATAIKETADSVRLAVVASLPTADITNFTLAIDTAFHTTAEKIGDLSLSVFEQTGVGVHEIVTGLGLIAPVADEAGLSIKSTVAILGIAEQKSGRSASSIAENFTRILPAIQKNGTAILELISTVPGLDKEFQLLGQDLNQGQSGKFLTDLIPAFAKLGTTTQNTVIELLGGRREAGALIPVLESGAQFADLMAKSTDNNGKSAEYFAKTMQTLSKQLSVVGAEFKNFIGDLFRSGLASGLTDVLKLIGFIFGGLQEVETVFKDIDEATKGWAGRLAGALLVYKTVQGVRGVFGGGGSAGAISPISAARESAAIQVAGAKEVVDIWLAGAEGSAGENVAGGALGGLGRGAAAGAAGPVVTDIFGGSAAAIPILPSIPVLPVALATLAGFAAYKSAVDDAKAANAAAAAEADKFTKSFLAQRNGLDVAISEFAAGNRTTGTGNVRTQQLVQQSKDLQALTDKLVASAQDAYIKRFADSVSDATPLGSSGPALSGTSPTVARLASHIPFVGGLFDRAAKQKTPDEFTKAVGKVGADVREALTKSVLIPFLNQYIKDASDNVAKVLVDGTGPRSGQTVGNVKIPTVDVHGRAHAAAIEQAGLAKAQLEKVKKILGDGQNEKNYDYAVTFLQNAEDNKDTAPSVKAAFEELKNKIAQAKQSAKSNETETLLDAQKQLYAAGAESSKDYLAALRKQIDALLQLQDASPLTSDLRLQLAQDLKEESDVLSALADQVSTDANFLAGLNQSGPQLAETKLRLAQTKLATLPKGPARTTAAQDVLSAQQDAFTQQLSQLSPGAAYADALKGFVPDPTAVNVLIQDQKDAIAGERSALDKQRDFYTKEIAALDEVSTGNKGRASTDATTKIAQYRRKLAQVKSAITALGDIPILDPVQAANKETADAQNQRALDLELLRAGDSRVKQAAARLNAATRAVAEDKKFYGKVLPDDAAAYYKSYNDLLFEKAFAAEQEKERALELAISASHDPQQKAALEQALADTKKAYATSIGQIPGHDEDTKNAQNDADQAGVSAANDARDAANSVAKARLDLLAAMTQDPIQLAQIAIQQADEEAREAAAAGDAAAQLEAAAHKLAAQHQLAAALSDARKAYSGFLVAVANFYGDGVKAAELTLEESNAELQDAVKQGLGPAEIANRAGAVINARRALLDASLQAKEATIDFNLQMKQISTAQAIALYTALLSSKNTVDEQRDLLLKIQSLKQSLNQDLQFNLPSDLNLPTLYTARRFDQGGGAAGFAQGNTSNDNRQITINVNGAQDAKEVAKQVVSALQGPPRRGTRARTY